MDLRSLSGATSGASDLSGRDEATLRKASQEFEAILLNYMLKTAGQTMTESKAFPKTAGHDLYRQLFTEEVSRSVARSRGTGIGDLIYKELKRSAVGNRPPSGR